MQESFFCGNIKMQLITMMVIVLCMLFVPMNAWTSIERTKNGSEYEGHCRSENKEVGILKIGTNKYLKSICAVVSCHEKQEMIYTGCGLVDAEPPCKVIDGDASKNYPDCCPTTSCPNKKIA